MNGLLSDEQLAEVDRIILETMIEGDHFWNDDEQDSLFEADGELTLVSAAKRVRKYLRSLPKGDKTR